MTDEIREAFSQFMKEELTAMSENVSEQYAQNAKNRKNNPFLAFESKDAEKYMGLGRSIDAQLGIRIQNIVFYLARLRYGAAGVPNIVDIQIDTANAKITVVVYYAKCELKKENFLKGRNPCQQTVYINGGIDDEAALKQMKFRGKEADKKRALGSKKFTFDNVDVNVLAALLKEKDKANVDLLFLMVDNALPSVNTFEIKLSGNLDTKNAKSNAGEVATLSTYFSFTKRQSFFASCYGECSDAVKREIKNHGLTESSILKASEFWKMVLPDNGDAALLYSEFIELYKEQFKSSGLEGKIKAL